MTGPRRAADVVALMVDKAGSDWRVRRRQDAHGRLCVDLRRYLQIAGQDAPRWPSAEGVLVPIHHIPAVVKALQAALDPASADLRICHRHVVEKDRG